MDRTSKLEKILGRIQGEPEYKRRVAENRFLLVDEFLHQFERSEIKRLGSRFSRRKAILQFCRVHAVGPSGFQKWLEAYEARGIKGLVPAYGNRKGSSPYTRSILPLIAEILEPGDTISAVHKKLQPICKELGLSIPSQKTVGRLLKSQGLQATSSRSTTIRIALDLELQKPLSCIKQLIEHIKDSQLISPHKKEEAIKLLLPFQEITSRRKPLAIHTAITSDEMKQLHRYRASLHKNHCAKATAILMANDKASLAEVVKVTGRHPATIRAWVRSFNETRLEFIEVRHHHPKRDEHLEMRRNRIMEILHSPPSAYDINRATWHYPSIVEVYCREYGERISTQTVRRTVKQAGYTWRRGRKVLTSPDPQYKQKIAKVLEVLRALQKNDAFFFVDEAGPYRVKKYGGVALTAVGEKRILPERQKAKGKVQFVIALEAVTNQLCWRFIDNKTAVTVVDLIQELRQKYVDRSRLFLTWDSISTHSASSLKASISRMNEKVAEDAGPIIEVVPLPSRAQFLNVVEAVLGGLKKAVILNSNYASVQEMQDAIARHFEARNDHFRDNPKKAGDKIWDEQRFKLENLAGGLFRRM